MLQLIQEIFPERFPERFPGKGARWGGAEDLEWFPRKGSRQGSLEMVPDGVPWEIVLDGRK